MPGIGKQKTLADMKASNLKSFFMLLNLGQLVGQRVRECRLSELSPEKIVVQVLVLYREALS